MTCPRCKADMVAVLVTPRFTVYEDRFPMTHSLRIEMPAEAKPPREPGPVIASCGFCERSIIGPCAKHGGLRGAARVRAHNQRRHLR